MSTQNASRAICVLALSLFTSLLLRADDPAPARPSADTLAAMASSLKWQTGVITLKDGLAKINLTPDFRFLGGDDARKVLHEMWNNPDDPDLLGMIFPKDKGPLDDDGWAVTINYESGGYVKDDDAEKINYDDLLKKMQQQTAEADPERVKEGYPSIELVGWAAPPRYDKATHKLYWAKELKVANYPEHTLNYDIRILGRRGVLVLGAISSMNQFPAIDQKTPEILAMVDFQPGNTYADFDPKIDKVAEYGLATLIAGGALAGAAKLGLFAGLFKWIIAGALALKKVLIVAIVAIVAGVKKLWGKVTGKTKTPDHLLPPRDNPPPR
ncbi:MAG TPA: DUF2167 domain-containing protein [Candidatus Methylacidiphilales bacterium]|jgi:uncharacterized membrane-anchored protein|nr:DUF2167 domain-containing protein [Candidatus Methylacidiphilales bacterium]